MTDQASYDPEHDPGVKRLNEARGQGASEEELREIMLELIVQTDNRPTRADPGHDDLPTGTVREVDSGGEK